MKKKLILDLLMSKKNQCLKNKDIIHDIFIVHSIPLKELEVRGLINELRNDGEPIIADSTGYKYVDNPTLLKEYVSKRKYEIKKECIALNRMCIKNNIQISLFEGELNYGIND